MDELFHERFAQALKRSKKTLQDIGDVFGITPQAVMHWKKGTSRPTPDRLLILAGELGVTTDWLQWGSEQFADGSGLSVTGQYPDYETSVTKIDKHLGRRIPLIDLEELSVAHDVVRLSKNTYPRHQIHTHFPCSTQAVAFYMRDKSMEPGVSSGDIIVIDPTLEADPGDLVLVKIVQTGRLIFRQFSRGSGNVALLPLNPLWEEFRFTDEQWSSDVEMIGVMSEHTRPRRT